MKWRQNLVWSSKLISMQFFLKSIKNHMSYGRQFLPKVNDYPARMNSGPFLFYSRGHTAIKPNIYPSILLK